MACCTLLNWAAVAPTLTRRRVKKVPASKKASTLSTDTRMAAATVSDSESSEDVDEAVVVDEPVLQQKTVITITSTDDRRQEDPLYATVQALTERKHFDMIRWRCISRPQYVALQYN